MSSVIVVCGDLNTKSEIMGCKITNNNGKLLENLILESNLFVANDNQQTYHRIHDNRTDILDRAIISNNMHEKLDEFNVLKDNEVDSDHYPIKITLKFEKKNHKLQNKANITFNYNKADWPSFQNQLNGTTLSTSNKTIDEIKEQLVNEIKKATHIHIPKMNYKNKIQNPLPSYLVDMIKYKKGLKTKLSSQQIREQELNITK
jgi:hypothetical protein